MDQTSNLAAVPENYQRFRTSELQGLITQGAANLRLLRGLVQYQRQYIDEQPSAPSCPLFLSGEGQIGDELVAACQAWESALRHLGQAFVLVKTSLSPYHTIREE